MCWIFAYNWKNDCIDYLIEWLRKLEYRWYDSAWIFWVTKSGNIFLEKSIWKVSNLASKINKSKHFSSNKEKISKEQKKIFNWISHTRWATHWKVTLKNTHPHNSENNRFFIVHNWIIENYRELKNDLKKKYNFYWNTDTEVIAKLIEYLFDGNILSTTRKVIDKLVWAFSIVIIDKENPEVLVWTKLWSPMIAWIWKKWIFISSDTIALWKKVNEIIVLEDREIIIVNNWKFNIYSWWKEIKKNTKKIKWYIWEITKGSFETFTEKEIHEVPQVLKNCLKWRINFKNKTINSSTLNKINKYYFENIEIIASWSSYFAWITWKSWFEELADIKTEVKISSEFLYQKFLIKKNTLYVFISQSWETADVRESIRVVKEKWWLTFWIVNSVWSTISRMCDMWLYTHSWIEIWVASTKNIIGQLWVLLLMALSMWLERNLKINEFKKIIEWLDLLKKQLEKLLLQKKSIQKLASKYSIYKNFFFLWRNLVYWTTCECSLKLKELSYLHAEAYSTWELKHWPLALINKNFPCIIINPKNIINSKTNSNIEEIKSRNWVILWIITKWDSMKYLYNDIIEIPDTHYILTPFLPLIPLWIFAIEIAKKLDKNIDKPKNLAKSVTVE